MLFLLSPAKTLDYDTPVPRTVLRHATQPLFQGRAEELIGVLRRKSVPEIAALMDLSEPLAELNVQRYTAWQAEAAPAHTKPAALAFAGEVYTGLQAASLKTADLRWAQDHVVILSGLYGALRPLDALQPYRLEMGTGLKTPRGANLYDFWGNTVVQYLNERQADEARPVVVNLASVEYAQVALRPAVRKALRARVVECVFEEAKGEGWQVVGFFAKKARGLMARYAIQTRARSVRQLQGFEAEGYALAPEVSGPDRLVFRRPG
jgi:cytoplasmic iron level regulating protein YaaA (DUF328/UPF0246 family)